MTKTRSYPGRVGLAWTRLLNALTGGDPDNSLSARVGAGAARGVWLAIAAAWIIDACFALAGAPWGHCARQAERETVTR